MPNFVCQNSDYYSPHGTEEIKVHKLEKKQIKVHMQSKREGVSWERISYLLRLVQEEVMEVVSQHL